MTEKNAIILTNLERYPDQTPTVMLMALTQTACGSYVQVVK